MKLNWYLGKIIEYPIIKDKNTKKVINSKYQMYWINDILLKAPNSETAYRKLKSYGKSGNYSFTNTDGNLVTWKFAGINDLFLIHDKLEDLAEIACYENTVSSVEKIKKLVYPKNRLTVFEWEKERKKGKKKSR